MDVSSLSGWFLRPYAQALAPKDVGGLAGFVETVKPLLPIPALLVVIPLLWLMFRKTWRELDLDSQRERATILFTGGTDRRPMVALVACALILTLQEYYGGRTFFDQTIHPLLERADVKWSWVKLGRYDELYGFGWWAGTRIGGYIAPFALWKIAFRNDSLLDMGLRTRGFFDHAWTYALFLAVVLPAMLVVSRSPDFGMYYPFYKNSQRSWFDFLTWEAMYFAQFFALEMFFRGFWLASLRKSFGSGAIFVMAVPYCMIHYGKPYLEACGAIIAGIALGSLSMKTKSIYQGFLVHITVAGLMDWLSLHNRHCTPLTFWPETVPLGCSEQMVQRDALAHKVDIGLAVVATVLLTLLALGILRARKRRSTATI